MRDDDDNDFKIKKQQIKPQQQEKKINIHYNDLVYLSQILDYNII